MGLGPTLDQSALFSFFQWLGADKARTVSRTNYDQSLWYHMASLSHSELACYCVKINGFNNRDGSMMYIPVILHIIVLYYTLTLFWPGTILSIHLKLSIFNFLQNCPQVSAKRHHRWLVNVASSNGMVPSRNKPLHESGLTEISDAIWRF